MFNGQINHISTTQSLIQSVHAFLVVIVKVKKNSQTRPFLPMSVLQHGTNRTLVPMEKNSNPVTSNGGVGDSRFDKVRCDSSCVLCMLAALSLCEIS